MTWKASLPCTRAEADRLGEDVTAFVDLDAPPALVTRAETDDNWWLDAYFEAKPKLADLRRLSQLVPSAAGAKPRLEELPEADWLTLSQAGLEPIRAGRFFVHTPEHRDAAPADAVAFEIPAGQAFGTGQHETTAGCLLALDRLRRSGLAVRRFVDVGTGTGLLAFAALHLWPAARGVASDIDRVAVAVTRENAQLNSVRLGRGPGRLDTVAAPGVDHPGIQAAAPYDLVIANILAGPLVDLAPRLAAVMAPGGRIVLAGLLASQESRVLAAYRRQGLRLERSAARGDWPCLVLVKSRVFRPRRRSTARGLSARASLGWSAL